MKQHRDFQRSKVYAWENEYFKGRLYRQEFPIVRVRAITRHIAKVYGMSYRPLTIQPTRGNRATAYPNRLLMPPWALNRHMIAHEMTHWLLASTPIDGGHGGKFMRVYVELIDWMGMGKVKDMEASLARAGITIAPKRFLGKPVRVRYARASKLPVVTRTPVKIAA